MWQRGSKYVKKRPSFANCLNSLSLRNTLAATIAAEKDIQTATQEFVPISWANNEKLSLKGSLSAVRKSAHAAALIEAAFRARSFRQRHLVTGSNDISLDLVALGSLKKVQRMGHFQEYLHSAAIKIQQKYRGWKKRKKFLNICSRIVKLQHHNANKSDQNCTPERCSMKMKVAWEENVVERVGLNVFKRCHGKRRAKENCHRGVKRDITADSMGAHNAQQQ
ncbi:unnamed protein product [Fraxinus pennsylvanica]|uniref:Uncharacterized protein n=1 Tax=Fraxinus pennsylvanica TaxID=56036 RepID=A0AAD1Z5C6_9LAMI|nr:unnamed protein product [Fraxinus pennsylvanica]